MPYTTKPKMILFDVGGTLFDDGKFVAKDGLSALRKAAENSEVTDDDTLAALWDCYMQEACGGNPKAKSGISLDLPLSSAIKYVTMKTGLRLTLSMAELEELFDRFNSERRVMDGIPELLTTLDTLGIRMAVISNNAMSGDSLALAIRHWLPDSKAEFCLTSADLLIPKPDKTLFECAAAYAGVAPEDCWYCGDSKVPDVDGSRSAGMTPVLIDTKSPLAREIRTDGKNGEYLTVNHWSVLTEILKEL